MQKQAKQPKFNFAEMKAEATSPDPAVRKKMFTEYFERFEEFPSYLFDNTHSIDPQLHQTIQDISKDPATTKNMHKGIEALRQRLPSEGHTS
jgi:hypothetical protein